MEITKKCLRNLSFCWAIALFLIAQTSSADEIQYTVLYEKDGMTVGIHKSIPKEMWCGVDITEKPIYAIYDVPHTERERLIGPSYEEFIRDIVYPSIIKHCGQIEVPKLSVRLNRAGNAGIWDVMTFAISGDGSTVVKTAYTAYEAEDSMTLEQIAALIPDQQGEPRQFTGKELYSDGKITIYAREDIWCYGHKRYPSETSGIDVVFPVPIAELQEWLNKQYGDFPTKVILPLVRKGECSSYPLAYFYRPGDSEYSELVRYDAIRERKYSQPEFKVASRSTGLTKEARLAAIRKKREALRAKLEAWGDTCSGPFCNLDGGAYLHAIYANDVSAIKRMDLLVNIGLQEMADNVLGNDGMAQFMHKFRNNAAHGAKMSLLPILADNYFYAFQGIYSHQCNAREVSKVYEWTNATYDTYLGGTYTGQGGGEKYSATYVLRTEFVPLCDRVCNHLGGKAGRQTLGRINHGPSLLTLSGLDDMSDHYICSDVAVRQFERNLISLTESYLDNKSTWISTE